MTRSFAPVLVVAAALVSGGAAVVGFSASTGDVVRVLVAVAVAAAGTGAALLPGADGTTRAAGTGLVAAGAWLAGSTAGTDLVRYGLPALVLVALAATGPRGWASGAGVLAVFAVSPAPGPAVVLAVVLAVVVVFASRERAPWADFAGAAAGAALLGQVSVVAALTAAVLLMTAAARRDLVTGLLAATVLVTGEPAHAWPLAVIVVVALVAIRVPAVRAAATRLPALRGTRPVYATAGAAVVAAGGLVGIALQLDVGWLTLVTALLAAALGHWLPVPAGPALAVVALAALGVEQPFGLVALVAVPLLWRHPVPPVFAAAAFLALRVSPLDPLPTVLVLGAVAAVFAFGRRTAPAGQAVGAVVLGAVAAGPLTDVRPEAVVLVPVVALAVSTGWRPSAPLAVTAALATYATTTLVARTVSADGAVVAALLVAGAALVVAAVFAARRHAAGDHPVRRA